ncbi:class I SAM-dependent methyltransferase [Puniceibacterium sediminis]|uniref:16S rRNA (Guanine1207-N2)-methyltransferase n=1 Tax=Puniceibacterium sediminis TaxID=1608407 RepID=A0A238UQL7_9RHOB|nr:methyltransferase [Puniceibacterium sediminis]SNR24430.1 16S rRNA (guanine1207-N2)-methyltransferase [Puniceibacterium sediminis]
MATSRLTTCLEDGSVVLPSEGTIALFGATADHDLSELPTDRCQVIQTFRPEHDALTARGFDCVTEPAGPYAMAVVFLPRARAQGQAMVAAACAAVPEGTILVDGLKTDGIEPMLKACRARADVQGQISKAHGKAVWFPSTDAFTDWTSPGPSRTADGYLTAPGVFSADGIDPASAALAAALPAKLGQSVADFGAGWGYLSTQILTRPEIAVLHVIEADHTALTCARANIDDPRAKFYWADVPSWPSPERLDTVVMNPPFHTTRNADPAIGQSFIAAAAKALKPGGHLWIVANRHLPYETTLAEHFGETTEVGGDGRFKILHAQRPSRPRR